MSKKSQSSQAGEDGPVLLAPVRSMMLRTVKGTNDLLMELQQRRVKWTGGVRYKI